MDAELIRVYHRMCTKYSQITHIEVKVTDLKIYGKYTLDFLLLHEAVIWPNGMGFSLMRGRSHATLIRRFRLGSTGNVKVMQIFPKNSKDCIIIRLDHICFEKSSSTF